LRYGGSYFSDYLNQIILFVAIAPQNMSWMAGCRKAFDVVALVLIFFVTKDFSLIVSYCLCGLNVGRK